jgi:hypothetical protein
LGVPIGRLVAALPPEAATRGPSVQEEADVTATTWALLTEDPMF